MSVEAIQVPRSLAVVLNRAGDKSGVDFDYLVQTAMRESSFNPQARAQTSSAVGLFQFVEGTWLEVMKLEGERLGYGQYARAIEQTDDGDFVIRDSRLRNEVLALREDPQISADLAAAFTRRNGEYLRNRFGRTPSPGELYIAHFLGARGAERMFNAGLENPDQIAAAIFPRQAEANRAIFYDLGGARTIREVYQALVAKHGQGAGAPVVHGGAGGVGETGASSALQASGTVQSRYGPVVAVSAPGVSFTGMFSVPPAGAGGQGSGGGGSGGRQVVVDPGGAFFVQLYGR